MFKLKLLMNKKYIVITKPKICHLEREKEIDNNLHNLVLNRPPSDNYMLVTAKQGTQNINVVC